MQESRLYRFREDINIGISVAEWDWLEPGRCYQGRWDDQFPPRVTAHVILYHPNDSGKIASVPHTLLEEVLPNQCLDL